MKQPRLSYVTDITVNIFKLFVYQGTDLDSVEVVVLLIIAFMVFFVS